MHFWQDIRFGLRSLKKNPGFTLIAALALALGIGPNTALFSVVYAAFFDSTGYPDADRMVDMLYQNGRGISSRDFLEFQRRATVFEVLSAKASGPGSFGEGADRLSLRGEAAVAGLLSKAYGIPPMLGRDFLPEENEPGRGRAVILGNRFWQSQFASDPKVLGQTIHLSGTSYVIVGVMPPRRSGQGRSSPTEVWTPLQFTELKHGTGSTSVVGRMKPGVTLTQAQAEMNRIVRDLAAEYPTSNEGLAISVERFRAGSIPVPTKTTLWLLAGTVCFVLLIACANLASLMVAKGTARRREIAVRMSLGASSLRLLAQLIVETLFVSTGGALLGSALGWALLKVLTIQLPSVIALSENPPQFSLPVLIATTVLSILAGVLFGSVPLWQSSRQDLDQALKAGTPGSAGRARVRLRRVLVVFEFAAATTLLAAAAICAHSLWQKTRTNLGIVAPEKLLVYGFIRPARLNDPAVQTGTPERQAFLAAALAVVRAVPGVQQAILSDPPLSPGNHTAFDIVGQPEVPKNLRPKATVLNAGEGYFETLGIPVLRGRGIEVQDTPTSEKVAVVNEAFVNRYLPNVDPLTQYVAADEMYSKGWIAEPRRIVGVYATIKRGQISDWPEPEIAVPTGQVSSASGFTVRTIGDPQEIRGAIAQAFQNFGVAKQEKVETVAEMAADLSARERGYAIVFGSLAGLALLLAGVGIYGVMAFMVAQRTREIGVRIALGATPRRIVELILKEGMLLAAVGLVLGLLGAGAASSSLQAVLNEAKAINYIAFGAAGFILLLCAIAACGVPAYRASEVDPVNSLRAD